MAQSQDVPTEENADTLFVTKVHQPISYLTSYDRNVSRGEWDQTLTYSQTTSRLAFNTDAMLTSIQGFHGLENNGISGNIHGSLDWRASKGWIWSVDGKFAGVSNNDKSSSTGMRANKFQI